MRLKYLETVIEQQDGAAKVAAIDWSPNGKKLAVANADNVVLLFDEARARRDKFATKPVDAKFGKKSYRVKAIVFAPDSSRLAIGQTDNIVFVYRLGESWNEKKVICNKFTQSSAVTAMAWPAEERLVIGLADGKVRLGSCRSNKCATLYRTEQLVTCIAQSPDRRLFISGHSDGSVIAYSFEKRTQHRIFVHRCAPFALAYATASVILAAGCDRRVVTYGESGRQMQQFDYNDRPDEKEFTVAVADSSGQNVAVGSFDRIRLYSWNVKRCAFDESEPLEIRHLYTVSALAWSPDGSLLQAGTLCGGVHTMECCLRRLMIGGRFETTYVSQSQVLINDTGSDRKLIIRSNRGLPIDRVKILGGDRFAVAYTTGTMLLGDLVNNRCSEIEWLSAGNEKFYFESDNVCMVINAGEVTFVEYGNDELLGWIRTELVSPHLISIRLLASEYHTSGSKCRVAYLLDVNTIAIVDLPSNRQLTQMSHPGAIDWIELSETATKLLYRDHRSQLLLLDISGDRKSSLLNYCTYVQWVPNSDVIVAQSGDQLCVWYQAENPDQVIMVPIKGEIETVLRDPTRTEVIVEEANAKVAYELDQTLIEFASALESFDFGRALDFLEKRPDFDSTPLWQQLAQVALKKRRLLIAQRCFAALGDISRVTMLADTIRIAESAARAGEADDGLQNYKVRARLALMQRDFKGAERIYLEQNALNEAIEMYQQNYMWEAAIELARAQNYENLEELKVSYYRNLLTTGQDAKAAEVCERDGDLLTAIDLYLKANQSMHAVRILLANQRLLVNDDLVQKISAALIRSQLFEKAGELFEVTGHTDQALESYRKGKSYNKAVQLARSHYPEEVVLIEEEWGDHLVSEANYDAAINHFLESGKTSKALDTSIKAKQWGKAAQIVNVIEDSSLAKENYGKIAEHHASIGELERAEMLYIEADMQQEAINMYNKAERWIDAHRLAVELYGNEKATRMYADLAQAMENSGRLKNAEQLYILIGKPNNAIEMYKNADQIDEMMVLVEKYHAEQIQTQRRLAADLERKGELRAAEEQYLLAGDWKAAVNMYRMAESWTDAFRIAKQNGGETAQKQVVYLWAKSLGGEAAVRLLQKYNFLDESIDFACDNGAFDFAFELCRLGAKGRLPSVHIRLAQQLEEEGKPEKAELQYIEGARAHEAVLMYVHVQDWTNAERVARVHHPESLPDVYIGQARAAIERQDFTQAESCLLRANRADIMLNYYRQASMWPEALRIAKDYVPTMLPQLQEEFELVQLKSGAKGAQSFLAQAQDWETQAEYSRAIQCYMKVAETENANTAMIVSALERAADIAIKFLTEDESAAVVEQIAENFIEMRRFADAAQLFLAAGHSQNAVKALILAGEWAKAKKVANELAPEMVELVDDRYKQSLKNEGRLGELIDVDVVSAIDALVERGQWDRALETARQQNHQPLLDKYVAQNASQLIAQQLYLNAVTLFVKYGAPAIPNNYNMYLTLAEKVINARDSLEPIMYSKWAQLRNMLLMITKNMANNQSTDQNTIKDFERYLEVAHYCALRCALHVPDISDEAEQLITRIAVTLIRYTDIVRADRTYFDAGIACRKLGKERLAFVLLNHYLDLCDAIEAQDASLVDTTSIFAGTDIPMEVPLPESAYIPEDEHDEVKEWVLAISVEQNVQRALPTDADGNFEASLIDVDGTVHQPCIISGYPVRAGAKHFGTSGRVADLEAWSKFVIIQRTKSLEKIMDVLQFIAKWTDTTPSLSL